jgi:S-formylglutathione hydrolase FrmB
MISIIPLCEILTCPDKVGILSGILHREANIKEVNKMKKLRWLIIVSLVLVLCSLSFEAYGQGSVINTTFYSKSLQMNRAVQIYLPEAYNQQDNTIRYPVIYWLNYAGGNSTTSPEIFGMLNDLISGDTISPVIIVKPDGSTNKNPWDGDSWYTNSELFGNFEDYIVFDLVEFIDSSYNTIASREKRAIMGGSMGALGAMRFAIKHPDVYRGVASHSGFPDMTKLSQYWPIILSENGGAPVSSYNPSAGEMTRIVGFSCSGAYSPNVNNPPYFVDFPLDSMGNLIDSVWNRWLLHNCALLVRNISQQSNLAIYFDCGMQDETLAYPFNTGFADTLDKLGLAYEFQSYTGGHYSPYRFPIGFKFLDSVMNKTATDIVEQEFSSPTGFVLYQNYPNPFNPATTISFSLPRKSFVSLKVFDALGREVAILLADELSAGTYSRQWNAAGLASGVYFYRLQAGDFLSTKKILLIK